MTTEIHNTLQSTTSVLIDLLSSFSDEQFNIIPFEGSWTVGQLTDHLKKSNQTILRSLNKAGKKADREVDARLPALKESMLDFETKLNAPAFILPEKNSYDKAEIIRELTGLTDELKSVSETANLSELINHPVFGEITKWEILHFGVYHIQRHIHQLKKISEHLMHT